jgi:uncharacterized membrane protein YqjE
MSEPAQDIVSRGKSLLDQLLGMAQTRLELLSTELQQEKLAMTRQWTLAVGAVICVCLAGVTLITLLAVAVPPHSRVTALVLVLTLFIGGALGCWIALRTGVKRPPFFSRVIQQLRLDRSSLREDS